MSISQQRLATAIETGLRSSLAFSAFTKAVHDWYDKARSQDLTPAQALEEIGRELVVLESLTTTIAYFQAEQRQIKATAGRNARERKDRGKTKPEGDLDPGDETEAKELYRLPWPGPGAGA